MRGCRLLRIAVLVVLTSMSHTGASDSAEVASDRHDLAAECAHLKKLCHDARSAKQDAEEVMATSRAFHDRGKSGHGDPALDRERQREGHDLEARLRAASSHRVATASAFIGAMAAATVKYGAAPACGSCPGITEGGRPPSGAGRVSSP